MTQHQPLPTSTFPTAQRLNQITLHQVLTFRLDQSALNKNFQIISKCLSKINDLSLHIHTLTQQLSHLKSRTGKSQGQISTLNKSIQLRKQFDLNKIIHCIEQHEQKLGGLEKTTNKQREDIDKLYDLAKYLDYDEVVRRVDQKGFFAREKETAEWGKQARERIGRLEKEKMDAEKCQKELKKCVQLTNYKSFYQDTNRDLIRLQKQKLSHTQFTTQNQKTLLLQQRMSRIDLNFHKLSQQVQENNKFVLSIDLRELESKIKKSKEELQYQINTLKPAVNSKISQSELEEFQKQMAERLEVFQQNAMESLAEKGETRKALVFLERRINMMIKLLNRGSSDDPQKDQQLQAMLTKTNPFHCASCSTNLGRVASRPGAYTSWSNFPMRQHLHEKDKQFETFVEKLALKRLSEPFLARSNADQKLELLADALINIKEKDNDDPTTTRTTNFMHSYGRSDSKRELKDRGGGRLVAISERKRPETRRVGVRREDEQG